MGRFENFRRFWVKMFGGSNLGSILIAIFAGLGMMLIFVNDGVWSYYGRELYLQYHDKFQERMFFLQWTIQSQSNLENGLKTGLIVAVTQGFFTYLVVNSGVSGAGFTSKLNEWYVSKLKPKSRDVKDYHDQVVALTVFVSFFAIFGTAALLHNPFMLTSSVYLVLIFITACLACFSSSLYVLFGMGRFKRALTDLSDEALSRRIPMEAEVWREYLHLVVWVFVSAIIAIAALLNASQLIPQVPSEVLASNQMARMLFLSVIHILVISTAYFLGLFFQIATEMGFMAGLLSSRLPK